MDKPVYNKRRTPGKQMGRGGPRDMQMRQKANTAVETPPLAAVELKRLIDEVNLLRKESRMVPAEPVQEGPINLSEYGLSFEQASVKIQQAIIRTQENEAARYKSSLESLDDQLNKARTKVKLMDAEFDRLTKENRFLSVENEELRRNGAGDTVLDNTDIALLRSTMAELLTKMTDGTITAPTHIQGRVDTDRPVFDDQVFIDPTDEVIFDSHINIDVDTDSDERMKRDIKDDLSKLRSLIDKGKYKETPIKPNDT